MVRTGDTDLFHQQFGGVVVAVGEHLGNHIDERLGIDVGNLEGRAAECRGVTGARLAGDHNAAVTEQPGEFAGGTSVRIIGTLVFTQHAGVVRDQRVVRPSFESCHAVPPTRRKKLIVVTAAIAKYRTGDLGDTSCLNPIGEIVKRCRVDHGTPLKVRRWIPVRREQGVAPANEHEVPLDDSANRSCRDHCACAKLVIRTEHIESNGGHDQLLATRWDDRKRTVGRANQVAVDRDHDAAAIVERAKEGLCVAHELVDVESPRHHGRHPPE